MAALLAALLGSAFAPMWNGGGALAADHGAAPAVRPRAARSVVCLLPPVAGPVVEPFRRPACPYCAGHRGLTYDTVPGEPVRAVAAGVVEYAGSVAGTRYVVVRHADGRRATYGRLLTAAVATGQRIVGGTVVGRAGDTLHLGIRAGDEYLDPQPLIGALRSRARLVPLGGAAARPGRPAMAVCPAARVGGVPSPLR